MSAVSTPRQTSSNCCMNVFLLTGSSSQVRSAGLTDITVGVSDLRSTSNTHLAVWGSAGAAVAIAGTITSAAIVATCVRRQAHVPCRGGLVIPLSSPLFSCLLLIEQYFDLIENDRRCLPLVAELHAFGHLIRDLVDG